jgi:hypothetical protein
MKSQLKIELDVRSFHDDGGETDATVRDSRIEIRSNSNSRNFVFIQLDDGRTLRLTLSDFLESAKRVERATRQD